MQIQVQEVFEHRKAPSGVVALLLQTVAGTSLAQGLTRGFSVAASLEIVNKTPRHIALSILGISPNSMEHVNSIALQ